MAKSVRRRSETLRIVNRWRRLMKSLHLGVAAERISFGRVYSNDPLDCGRPDCGICSYEKVYRRKERRTLSKREVAQIVGEELGG